MKDEIKKKREHEEEEGGGESVKPRHYYKKEEDEQGRKSTVGRGDGEMALAEEKGTSRGPTSRPPAGIRKRTGPAEGSILCPQATLALLGSINTTHPST